MGALLGLSPVTLVGQSARASSSRPGGSAVTTPAAAGLLAGHTARLLAGRTAGLPTGRTPVETVVVAAAAVAGPPDSLGVDTVIRLEAAAVIRAERLRRRPVGSTGELLTDSLGASRSVAERLADAGVYVRDYGPGSLASVSVRGGAAAHTLALWNGLPLTNPSLGQLDWSLLRAGGGGATTVALVRGGNSALWGSGAVAATVSLDDERDAAGAPARELALTVGAFGERAARGRVRLRRGGLETQTRADFRQTDNDYPVRRPGATEAERLTNAGLRQLNLRQDLYLGLAGGRELEAHYWYQGSRREIPPTLTQRRSAAEQRDGAHRLSLGYSGTLGAGVLRGTVGGFAERLDYRDTLAGVDSRSGFAIGMADLSWTRATGPGAQLLLGTTARHTRAHVDDAYGGETPRERAVDLLASYRLERGRWSGQASARYGWADGYRPGLTPALGVEYAANRWLGLRARAGRDFRAPTFNDRYYRPGGNPELRPEAGLSLEAGADVQRGGWTTGVTAFRRDIRDWLQWGQAPGQAYFSAYNLTRVTSSGVELRVGFRQNLSWGLAVDLRGGHDYVRAENRRALTSPRLDAGQQLWYVPLHSAFASGALTRGEWHLRYLHRWRGATTGINDEVGASQTGDLRVGYVRSVSMRARLRVSGFAEVINVGDVDYRLIERRPLPGRHVRVGLGVGW